MWWHNASSAFESVYIHTYIYVYIPLQACLFIFVGGGSGLLPLSLPFPFLLLFRLYSADNLLKCSLTLCWYHGMAWKIYSLRTTSVSLFWPFVFSLFCFSHEINSNVKFTIEGSDVSDKKSFVVRYGHPPAHMQSFSIVALQFTIPVLTILILTGAQNVDRGIIILFWTRCTTVHGNSNQSGHLLHWHTW